MRKVIVSDFVSVDGVVEASFSDEYRLMVFPVVLGSGRRLFPDDAADKRKLVLADTRTHANGVQLNILRPVR